MPVNVNTQMASRVFNGLPFGKAKYEYLMDCIGAENIPDMFVPLLRYHNNFSNYGLLMANLKGRKEELSGNYYNGFHSNSKSMSLDLYKKNFSTPTKHKKNYTLKNTIEYKSYANELEFLIKIIELCKSEDVNVVLFKTPVISCMGNIEKYSSVYSSVMYRLADRYDINAIDYNHLWRTLIFDNTCFIDVGHLNVVGAAKLTGHLAHFYSTLNSSIPTFDNLITQKKWVVNKKRGLIQLAFDIEYGEGIKLTKIYQEQNYNMLTVIPAKKIKQPSADYLPYQGSVIVKDVENVGEENLQYILTIYTGKKA